MVALFLFFVGYIACNTFLLFVEESSFYDTRTEAVLSRASHPAPGSRHAISP